MPDYTTTPEILPTITQGVQTTPSEAVPTLLKTIDDIQQTVPPIADSTSLQLLGAGILGLTAVIGILIIASMALWIWSLVHIAKNPNFKDENQKIVWLLVVLFTGVIGSIVYLFAKPTSKKI